MMTHKATGRDDRPLCGGKGHVSVIDALVTCRRCRLRMSTPKPAPKPRTKHASKERGEGSDGVQAGGDATGDARGDGAHGHDVGRPTPEPSPRPSAIHKTPDPYCPCCGHRAGHWPGCKEK